MQKVKLDVQALAVDSFPVAGAMADAGTVRGFEVPTPPYASCGCTTGASYLAAYCPPPSTKVCPSETIG